MRSTSPSIRPENVEGARGQGKRLDRSKFCHTCSFRSCCFPKLFCSWQVSNNSGLSFSQLVLVCLPRWSRHAIMAHRETQSSQRQGMKGREPPPPRMLRVFQTIRVLQRHQVKRPKSKGPAQQQLHHICLIMCSCGRGRIMGNKTAGVSHYHRCKFAGVRYVLGKTLRMARSRLNPFP